jgi:hypothetical protein
VLKNRGDIRTESRIAAPLRSLKNVGLVDSPDAISRMVVGCPTESTRRLCQSVPPKMLAVMVSRRIRTSCELLKNFWYLVTGSTGPGSTAVRSG